MTAEINRRIADVNLRASTINTVANTRNAYWDLVYAIQAVESAKTSLALAQKLVEDNKIRVEIGTLAPLDIISAEAEQASRQQTLVSREQSRRTAELVLKRLIVGGTDDPLWNVALNPTDRPATDVAEKIDLEAALRTALENRTDVVTARRNLEISDIGLKYLEPDHAWPGHDGHLPAGAAGAATIHPQQVTRDRLGARAAGRMRWAVCRIPPRPGTFRSSSSYPIGTSSRTSSYARARSSISSRWPSCGRWN